MCEHGISQMGGALRSSSEQRGDHAGDVTGVYLAVAVEIAGSQVGRIGRPRENGGDEPTDVAPIGRAVLIEVAGRYDERNVQIEAAGTAALASDADSIVASRQH